MDNSNQDVDVHQLNQDLFSALGDAVAQANKTEAKNITVLEKVQNVFSSGLVIVAEGKMSKDDWKDVEDDFLEYIQSTREYITQNWEDDAGEYMKLIRQSLKIYSMMFRADAFRDEDGNRTPGFETTEVEHDGQRVKIWSYKSVLPKDKAKNASPVNSYSYAQMLKFAEKYFSDKEETRQSKAQAAFNAAITALDQIAGVMELDAKARTPFRKLSQRCIEITNSDKLIAEEKKKQEKLDKKKREKAKKAREDALTLKKYDGTKVAA